MKNNYDDKFDDQFRSIQGLHWLPWIGKDYLKVPPEKKLLIVGESHYVPKGDDPEDYDDDLWTRRLIGNDGKIGRFIGNTERIIFKGISNNSFLK